MYADVARRDGEEGQHHQRQVHAPVLLRGLFSGGGARLSGEGQADLPHRVEGRQEGRRRQHPEDHRRMCPGVGQNLILAPEARRHEREAAQRQPADQERPGCDRDTAPQAAHVKHVLRVEINREVMPVMVGVFLAVLHSVNDRAAPHKEQRLEDRVRQQVEGRRHIRADPDRRDHVAKLADRRVGQHLLDVALGERDRRREERRKRADGGDDRHLRGEAMPVPADRDQREHADQQVDTGGDHRRGVDHGADRRRAFHRVRQPGVERELRALADRPQEEQDADRTCHRQTGQQRHALPQIGEGCRLQRTEHLLVVEDVAEVERPREAVEPCDAEQHKHIAHARCHEGLDARDHRRDPIRLVGVHPVVPEADQQVTAQPHDLPADEKQQQVIGHAEHQHRARKQGDESHEAGFPGRRIEFRQPATGAVHDDLAVTVAALCAVLALPFDLCPVVPGGHITGAVDEDHRRRERHEEQHHRAQRINQRPHREAGLNRSAQREPDDARGDGMLAQAGRRDRADQDDNGDHPRDQDRAHRHQIAETFIMAREQQNGEESQQGRERYQPDKGLKAHHILGYHLSMLISSATTVSRLR